MSKKPAAAKQAPQPMLSLTKTNDMNMLVLKRIDSQIEEVRQQQCVCWSCALQRCVALKLRSSLCADPGNCRPSLPVPDVRGRSAVGKQQWIEKMAWFGGISTQWWRFMLYL
jgi:hypothetical protein